MRFNRADIAKVLLAAVGLLTSLALQAQYYDDPGLGQKPVAAHPQDYKPLGVRAGSFMLHPGMQLAAEYTDNAFYTNRNTESDTIFPRRAAAGALGVLLIGLTNLAVSFGLALRVALRSRGIGPDQTRGLARRVLQRFLDRPRDFFWPPAADPAC